MRRVAVAIIEREGRILIARRESDDPLKGLWEFPGGKIEPGETPEDCIRREVSEELGLTVNRVDFLCSSRYDYAHASVELFAFVVRCDSGEPGRTFYRTMKWVRPDELGEYDFPAANVPIIERLAIACNEEE